MLVTTDADARNDRCGCHVSAFYYSLHSILLTVSCPRTLIFASSDIIGVIAEKHRNVISVRKFDRNLCKNLEHINKYRIFVAKWK